MPEPPETVTNPPGLALVLAADASASVTFEEFNLIAGGLAAAIRDTEIAAALAASRAIVSVLVFSGADTQDVAIDRVTVASEADAHALAGRIDAMPRFARPGLTAIGNALALAETLLAGAPGRRIIDIAGDGRANDGEPPAPIRDRLVADGITINGLCILHEEPDLVASYEREVTGGEGSFVLTCRTYADFAEAMRRKLLRELLVA